MVNHPNRKRILLTLQSIRDAGPCVDGWTKLLKALPPKSPMTLQISLGDIAKANDAADALWCIRALDWSDIAIRRRVISGAVLPAATRALAFTKNIRVSQCVNSIAQWCKGDDTIDLLKETEAAEATEAEAETAEAEAEAAEAEAAARSAWSAWSAARSAWSAAWSAEWSAEAAAAAAEAWSARSAEAAELEQQRADIIKAFPPVCL